MAVRKKFDEEFAALSPEQVAELKHRAEKEQHAKIYAPKQTKRAQKCDVAQVSNSFEQAVSAQCFSIT